VAAALPVEIEAVVIDLDGTLVDSVPGIAEAVRRMLLELGRALLPAETVRDYVGQGIGVLVRRVLAGSRDGEPDPALLARALPSFERHYSDTVSFGCAIFPGVPEGIAAFRAAGARIGCVTNKAARYTEALLAALGLGDEFEVVVSGDTLPHRKPHPAPLLHAAERLGVAPARMLMIGDSGNDVAAARAAGCPVFCVDYGYSEGEDIRGLDTDAIVASLVEAARLARVAPASRLASRPALRP
jgi:phosphoglycolate phosphatase